MLEARKKLAEAKDEGEKLVLASSAEDTKIGDAIRTLTDAIKHAETLATPDAVERVHVSLSQLIEDSSRTLSSLQVFHAGVHENPRGGDRAMQLSGRGGRPRAQDARHVGSLRRAWREHSPHNPSGSV